MYMYVVLLIQTLVKRYLVSLTVVSTLSIPNSFRVCAPLAEGLEVPHYVWRSL
jgi:hypothetical protein